MEKEAIAAKTLLKALAIGGGTAAAAGGAGYAGYRTGAKRTANAMASAFTEANQRENMGIRNSFNAFNKKENAALANAYLRRGMAVGAHLHAAGKIKLPSEMKKAAEEVYEKAFNEEFEKVAIPLLGTLGKSFLNLGKGLAHQAGHIGKQFGGKAKRKMALGTRLGHMGRSALTSAKGSKAAIGTTLGAGYALS